MRISPTAASAALAVVCALLLPAPPEAAAAPVAPGCPKAQGRVVCISLETQKLWLTRDGKRIWGPAPIRSGRPA
ncbi:hypothetical protein GUY60_36860, partial [Streptomyces sp. YC537]|nr:hypothetical protein [Streptomyces boluensis]